MKTTEFSPFAQPVVTDVKSCEAWLSRASLADARQACRELTSLLESLDETPPASTAFVAVLERLREPIYVAQSEHAKRYAARPLPLTEYEATAFDQACDLWLALARAYRSLLRSAVEQRVPELQEHEALLAQRNLDCVGELMLTHYRARREIDGELWQDLHRLYLAAEHEDVATTTVSGGYRSRSLSSCAEVYVRALLLSLGNPYSLGLRELGWTRRWASMWANKIELVPAHAGTQSNAVDLTGNAPPTWMTAEGATPTMRFLETAGLRRSIRSRIQKLDTGADPLTLGLGKDCVQPDVGRLLVQLARAWVEMPAPRQFTRRLAGVQTDLACGIDAIYFAVSGKRFKGAARHWDYSRREAEQIHTYQGVGPSVATVHGPTGAPPEKWETLDESANGFRLRRKGTGERLALGQLVALRPQGARAFILSDVRWLMCGADGALYIGAAALPGLAKGVAVRPATLPNNEPEPYTQAFMLPRSAAHPASIVVPSGWFQSGREVELRDDDELLTRLRLTTLAQRGYDYDRASFSVVGAASP